MIVFLDRQYCESACYRNVKHSGAFGHPIPDTPVFIDDPHHVKGLIFSIGSTVRVRVTQV